MSGRRRRDSLAPSLFPFLAVLLCTMGSLVLILMLIVSGAQADAKSIAQEAEVRRSEVESLAEHSVRSFQEQFEAAQLELEEERLVLQHFEEHILELEDELEELQRTADKLEEKRTEISQEDYDEQLSELESQLAEAAEKLKQKLDKPDGDKPVFAVIPYEGPNGTHRRPIYLECTEAGIVIQPEGNVLTLTDLQPPYGPGNPLDAALRAIRTEYKPENGAITHTAYPLLLVRPSGVQTYMMARAAMRGWDDQFGYELVGSDLELVFPDGEPGLETKIAKSIELARQRQEALAMAMPRKYQGRSYQPLNGSSTSYAAEANSVNGSVGAHDSSELLAMEKTRGSTASDFSASGTGGGYRALQNSNPRELDRTLGMHGSSTLSGDLDTAFGNSFFGGSTASGSTASGSPSSGSPSSRSPSSGSALSMDGPANGERSDTSELSLSQSSSGSSYFGNGDASESSGQTATNRYADSANGSSEESSGRGDQQQTSDSLQNSLGNASGNTGSSSSGSATASRTSDLAGGSPSAQREDSSQNPSSMGPPQLMLDLSKQKELDQTRPVAARRGRDWAWSNRNNTQTAVVRPVRLQCLEDRWVLLPDQTQGHLRDSQASPSLTIPFDGTPQQRTEYLVEAIHRRVEEWGMAVTGGYWKPKLVVEVGPDAQWRYLQLVRLLEGSGLELERRQTQVATPNFVPSKYGSPNHGPSSNRGGVRR